MFFLLAWVPLLQLYLVPSVCPRVVKLLQAMSFEGCWMLTLYSILAVMDLGRLFQFPEHSSGFGRWHSEAGKTVALNSSTVLKVSPYSQPQDSLSFSSFSFLFFFLPFSFTRLLPCWDSLCLHLTVLCKNTLFLSPLLAIGD